MLHNQTYMGMKILVDDKVMINTHENWSKVRSPGRARRRLKRGFKQNLIVTYSPKQEIYKIDGMFIMHPEVYKKFIMAAAQKEQESLNYVFGNVRGNYNPAVGEARFTDGERGSFEVFRPRSYLQSGLGARKAPGRLWDFSSV